MRKYKVNMHCHHCEKAVDSALSELDGIVNYMVNLEDKSIVVKGDIEEAKLMSKIKELGYEIERLEEE